jgi:hypothetical protein
MLPGPAFCKHGRLTDGCEDCALLAAMERGYRPQAADTAQLPKPERAEVDLYCDQGDGRYMLVIAGDVIPPALVHLPRVPRTPPERDTAADKPPPKRGR